MRKKANRTMMRKFFVWPSVMVALAALIACAAPEIRPEVAVMNFPVDEVWQTFVEFTKEWGFELETVDASRHLVRAGKVSTSVIAGSVDSTQRFGQSTRTQVHTLRASMKPRGDQSTVIEIVYVIDKVADEEASFTLLNAVRDRLARKDR